LSSSQLVLITALAPGPPAGEASVKSQKKAGTMSGVVAGA
jgi:hypothetical protein